MKKLVKINYKDITNIVKQLVKEQEDDTIIISPQEFRQYLEYVSYKGDALGKFPKFKNKKIIVDSDLDLSGTPLDSLGPLYKVNGRLNVSRTNIKSLGNLDMDNWKISYYDTPLDKMEKKRIFDKKVAEQESKREDGEWDIENGDPIGLKAHALLKYLDSAGKVKMLGPEETKRISEIESEIERLDNLVGTGLENEDEILEKMNDLKNELEEYDDSIDVYSIYPDGNYYRLSEFEILSDNLKGEAYAVGEEDEVERSCYEYTEQLINDTGIQGFNTSFVEDYIDVDELIEYFDYESDVRNNLEVYFSDDDNELSHQQEEKIKVLREKFNQLQQQSNDLDMTEDGNGELYDELQESMEEILSEIDDIESSPEGEPSEEKIQDVIDELNNEIKNDPVSKIKEQGLDMSNFINEREFIQAVVDSDGYGTLSSYDGQYDSVRINDTTYYIFRIN
jgi:hypothetical protein